MAIQKTATKFSHLIQIYFKKAQQLIHKHRSLKQKQRSWK